MGGINSQAVLLLHIQEPVELVWASVCEASSCGFRGAGLTGTEPGQTQDALEISLCWPGTTSVSPPEELEAAVTQIQINIENEQAAQMTKHQHER